MKASECKAKLLAVLDEVEQTREPVTVTKNGRPVAQIVPAVEKPRTLLGALKDSTKIFADLSQPEEPDWDEDREWKIISGQPYDDDPGQSRSAMARARASTARKSGARRVRPSPDKR
ncbi:MAG: type II toxin-antitoxin system Phd/YefM family antitoxin [Reyranellaceae bacterium]